jgi:tRNA G10  N-methylase Trm11
MKTLGGTVKIAEVVGTVTECNSQEIARIISPYFNDHSHITFGLSIYGDNTFSIDLYHRLQQELKTCFQSEGKHVRFIEARHTLELTSVQIQTQRAQEILCAKREDLWVIALTRSVQDYQLWNMRDYSRPKSNVKEGMLPPKVSRMIVNSVLGQNPQGKKMADPFCGVGTILMEGALVGADVYGSDVKQEAVTSTMENMRWVSERFPSYTYQQDHFFQCDAVHLSDHMPTHILDAIVTEPYMGPTGLGIADIPEKQIHNIAKGLNKLYVGCLKDWKRVLKIGGYVMMAFPEIRATQRKIFVKTAVDTCEKLGYSTIHGPITYSRPDAVVRRQFYLLRSI